MSLAMQVITMREHRHRHIHSARVVITPHVVDVVPLFETYAEDLQVQVQVLSIRVPLSNVTVDACGRRHVPGDLA